MAKRVMALVAGAAVLAGCSSSSSHAGQSGATGSATTAASSGSTSGSAPGVTKTSITVGGVVTFTSASGFSESGVDVGARARFAAQNAQGGVYGRKINYIGSKDDGLNPATDLQLAQALVQESNVFAAVPIGAPAFNNGGTFLVRNQVPFIGWGTTPPFCGNQYGFGVFGCDVAIKPTDLVSTATGGIIGKILGGTTGKTAAVVSSDNQAGKATLPSSKAGLVAAGLKVVYAEAALPAGGVTDYSPYAHQIMTSNNGHPPDAVFYSVETNQVIGLRQALAADGYKGIEIDGVTYSQQLLQNPQSKQALQGEYALVPFEPFEDSTSAVNQMLSDLRKQVGSKFVPDQYEAYGYWMADLFIAMLKKTGPNLTRQSFLAAANSFSYQVPGGLGQISFPAAHMGPAPCSSAVQLKGDKFVTTVPLTCYSTAPLSSGQ